MTSKNLSFSQKVLQTMKRKKERKGYLGSKNGSSVASLLGSFCSKRVNNKLIIQIFFSWTVHCFTCTAFKGYLFAAVQYSEHFCACVTLSLFGRPECEIQRISCPRQFKEGESQVWTSFHSSCSLGKEKKDIKLCLTERNSSKYFHYVCDAVLRTNRGL